MKISNIQTLIMAILLLVYADVAIAQQSAGCAVEFRPGSDMLYNRYGDNINEIAQIKELISTYQDVIVTGNGHIRLVAPVGGNDKDDLYAINLAAARAMVVRNLIKQHFRMLTNWSFTFYLDDTRRSDNTIQVQYIPQNIPSDLPPTIYYTKNKSNLAAIKEALSKYKQLPYLSNIPATESDSITRARFDKINSIATNPVDVEPKEGEPNPTKMLIAIHYRWDKDNLDSLYLSNPENLYLLDSILNSKDSGYIDTLTIVAYASPEGQPDHNRRLSERRAKTIKDYITHNYKSIEPDRIITEARGENWAGLRNFAVNDPDLPSRDEVLEIIDSPLSSLQKQSRLTKLNNGTTYYRYIQPNYYRYLRNGASVLITYSIELKRDDMPTIGPKFALKPIAIPLFFTLERQPPPIAKYPIALKTNLLFDAVGAPNIGIEIPIGKHFSIVGDFAYAYWRTPNNLFALQTLEGGIEARYWFGVSDKKIAKNREWSKPLRGWNIGAYGMYCSRYDIQIMDGYQGDGFWSAGLTGGYATPVARNLTLEFSLAAGYFYTPQYRHYHRPEYDANGKYHLMWQETGNFGVFTLTKARISLVWLIPCTKNRTR